MAALSAGAFVIGCAWALAAAGADSNAPADADSAKSAKEALGWLNPLVGEWRGVGQPRRGSRTGAWLEQGEWVWDFSDGQTAVRYEIEDGKQLKTARITWDADDRVFQLTGTFADDAKRTLRGRTEGDKLVLDSEPDDDGLVHRLTITRLNEKRTLVLYETRRQPQKFFTRVAEVGYTRSGTSLAVEGAGEPECVVTGGKGTIKVTHEGRTYYVCCTGCKQAFDDDPEGVLAEYRERVKARSEKVTR